MTLSQEQFAAASKASIDTLTSVASTTLSIAERLSALNLSGARTALESSTDAVKSMLDVSDPKSVAALQVGFAQSGLEKSIAHVRSVYDVLTESQSELTKLFDGQLAEVSKSLGAALEKAAESAPAGSDVAIAAVKSAIATANSTYDSVSKAARQVVELAEANLSATTEAAVKAVSETAKKAAA